MLGSSCGGTLSLATAHKLIALGRKGQLKGAINMAGGTVCEDYVPEQVHHLMKSMEENAVDIPIINRDTTRMINGMCGYGFECKVNANLSCSANRSRQTRER